MKLFSIVSYFVVSLVSAVPAAAQVFPHEAKKDELQIIATVEVRKNEECWSATKRTNFPLSVEECRILLAENKRFPRVDTRNPMMQIMYPPPVYKGEQFHYVFGVHGNGWVFKPER